MTTAIQQIKSIKKVEKYPGYPVNGYMVYTTNGLSIRSELNSIKDIRKVFSKSIAHKYLLNQICNQTPEDGNNPVTKNTAIAIALNSNIILAVENLINNGVSLEDAITLGNQIAKSEIKHRAELPGWILEHYIAKCQFMDALHLIKELESME